MGKAGRFIGVAFFLLVLFAAITSSVSILEAMVSSIMDKFGLSRKKSTVIASIYGLIVAVIVCLGYNKLYFEATFSTVKAGQILDILDYISNNVFMPLVAIFTCILIGWIAKPEYVICASRQKVHFSTPFYRLSDVNLISLMYFYFRHSITSHFQSLIQTYFAILLIYF